MTNILKYHGAIAGASPLYQFDDSTVNGLDHFYSFEYFNKPIGVKYHLENSSDFDWDENTGKITAVEDKAAVIIIGPDMILLKP